MKLTRTFIVLLAAAFSLALFAACSNDTVDVASQIEDAVTSNSERTISLEGTSLYGSLLDARFVGAHTAYITMHGSLLSDDENLYTYHATPVSLTIQMQKICAPDGSGRMLTEDGYIGYWNSKEFVYASIVTSDITSWYKSETLTCTATDGTVYTFTNKTTYTRNGENEISSVMTTSGSKVSGEIETPLFSDVPGYTELESEYSASDFTDVVTVHVYMVTTSIVEEEEVVSIAPYTGYPLEIGVATIGETVSDIGSDDADTQENINLRKELFASRYDELSANDWALVKAAFKPYSFSYETNKTVTESYINDDDSSEESEVTYDYYLTQHYSAPENAVFISADDISAAEKTIAAFSGLRGLVSTVDAHETLTMYETVDAATTADTLTFAAVPETDDDDESGSDTELSDETISARYELNENGDNTTLTLTFETKAGFTVSGKTIKLEYSPVSDGLMITD